MALAYTINKLLTQQQAIVERDAGERDEWGAETKTKREIVGEPIPCIFWWWHQGGARSPAREYAEPQRTIDFSGGSILVPPESDILATDWIAEIQNPEGETVIPGPFRVVSVETYPEHTEVALMRP